MEIPIVNEQDEIIGYRERSERGGNDIVRITALVLKNSKGEALIAQRSYSKKLNPGKWGPSVTGTVEKGETYDSNIVKEVEEEIGLVDIELKPYKKVFYTISGEKIFCMIYTAVCDKSEEEFILEKDGVEAVKWINPFDLEEWKKREPEAFVPGDDYFFELIKNAH